MGFYLGIDLGTSYFKAGVFDRQGNLVGLGRCAVTKQMDGVICELPVADFWSILRESVAEAVSKSGVKRDEIVSASYSSQANSFILLDNEGNPLTPLILWTDRRAEKIPTALQSLIEREDFLKKTGLGIAPGVQSMVAKIAWFQKNRPEIWKQVNSVMSISDYLTFSLTGRKVSDFSTASMTGLFDVVDEKWWDTALNLFEIDKKRLNSLRRIGAYVDALTAEGAEKLSLSVGTKFFIGGLDHHMVAVGSGLIGSTNISESTGTVLACVNYRDGYSPKSGINTAPGLKQGSFFQMAFNENGATALEWYQQNFASENSIVELLKMAENVPPGCDGLKAMPSADKYDGLSGFQNIQDKHTHGHFVRAILESTGLSLKQLIQLLDENNASKAVISSGGGARSQLWMQIKADMLNKTFIVPECSELACQGAAKNALQGMLNQNKKAAFSTNTEKYALRIFPNQANVKKYKTR